MHNEWLQRNDSKKICFKIQAEIFFDFALLFRIIGQSAAHGFIVFRLFNDKMPFRATTHLSFWCWRPSRPIEQIFRDGYAAQNTLPLYIAMKIVEPAKDFLKEIEFRTFYIEPCTAHAKLRIRQTNAYIQ